MKIKEVISDVLFENKEQGLFIFYKINIFLQNFLKDKQTEQPVQQTATQQPQPGAEVPQPGMGIAPQGAPPPLNLQQSTEVSNANSLMEDVFKSSSEGKLVITRDEADNIQTLEDLLDFMINGTTNGPKVMNDVIVEIIKTVTGSGTQEISDLVTKGDKLIIGIDYGINPKDSVGFKLNKLPGSETISLSMKKDAKVIPGNFDIDEFNKQLIFYRNNLLDK